MGLFDNMKEGFKVIYKEEISIILYTYDLLNTEKNIEESITDIKEYIKEAYKEIKNVEFWNLLADDKFDSFKALLRNTINLLEEYEGNLLGAWKKEEI